MVNEVEGLAVVGVPVITPVLGFRVTPGNGLAGVHVYGPVPPEAVNVVVG
jgi:hypothetical protein